MKTKLAIIISAALAAVTFAAIEPSALTYTVNVSGGMNKNDAEIAKWIVNVENERRAAGGLVNLPITPNNVLKNSFEIALASAVQNYVGASSSRLVSESIDKLTEQQRRDVHRAVVESMRVNGKTLAQILAAIDAP